MVAPAQTALTPVETRFTRTIDKRLLKYIRAHEVIHPGEHLVVAVSGGPDSTAMLLMLHRLAPALGLALSVAHFDHMLRDPADHAADREFVAALCASLELPLDAGRGDVPARVRSRKESLEEAARNLRYAFLGEESKARSATAVAVGHTVDDRAETVLLHLIRGAGLDGLGAMPPRSPWPFGEGPDLARPLLALTREETERYCRESGVAPRHDPSNDQVLATRNRLRHELMPLLRDLNPRISRSLNRLAESAARDTDFLEAAAEIEWQRHAQFGKYAITFDRGALAELHPALGARLFRRAAVHLGGAPESDRIDELLAVLPTRGRTAIDISGNVTATIARGRIVFSRKRGVDEPEQVR
jgi:tRNA(Ile)-lysidine synthase